MDTGNLNVILAQYPSGGYLATDEGLGKYEVLVNAVVGNEIHHS
ncbi:hypothetical protein Hanom_Chr07g00626231 [Helianthus anomalus]